MAELTDLKDLNKNVPASTPRHDGSATEAEHGRVEREADKMADRARERQQKNEAGGDFHNIGPA
jgi:hypothetical protein